MFTRMQIKLTLFFTGILIAVLIGTNGALYFILLSYNNNQIINETEILLDSIAGSDWIEEAGTEILIDGVSEDEENLVEPELNNYENDNNKEIEESEIEEGNELSEEKIESETEKTEAELDVDDETEDNINNENETEAEDGINTEDESEIEDEINTEDESEIEDEINTEDESEAKDEINNKDETEAEVDLNDESPESDMDNDDLEEESESDEDDEAKANTLTDEKSTYTSSKSVDVNNSSSIYRSIGHQFYHSTLRTKSQKGRVLEPVIELTIPYLAASDSASVNEEGHDEEAEIEFNSDTEILTPDILDLFAFYFVYDNEGKVLKWKNDYDDELTDYLIKLENTLVMNGDPKIINEDVENEYSFIVQKLPIIVNDTQIGYFVVGRDISIANETLANMLRILKYSLIIGFFLSLIIGYLIAGLMLKPIKEAYGAKQDFLADASHELRTPISVVMLSCDTLDTRANMNENEVQEVIDGIRSESALMGELVEKLLDIARFDGNSIQFNKERINLTEILKANMRSYQYMAEEIGIHIIGNIEKDMYMNGDQRMIHSLFSILIDNAIKYNSEGGFVKINATSIFRNKKSYLEIVIEDDGKGIDDKSLKKIFERFYRVEKSRNKVTPGQGLGLSIAQEVVSIHKGKISVESSLGKGSVFKVILPV